MARKLRTCIVETEEPFYLHNKIRVTYEFGPKSNSLPPQHTSLIQRGTVGKKKERKRQKEPATLLISIPLTITYLHS